MTHKEQLQYNETEARNRSIENAAFCTRTKNLMYKLGGVPIVRQTHST